MKTIVYILYSEKLNRFYTGLTTLNIEERLNNHLEKKYSSLNFTRKANDWKIFLFIECKSTSHGRKLELFIKKMKSSKFILSLKDDPEKLQNIIERTNKS